jgi:hypothetical protein
MRTPASMFVLVAVWTVALAACGSDHPLTPLRETGGPLGDVTGKPDVAAPSNAVGVTISDTRIDLSWQDNSDNEARFEIHRSTSGATGPFTLYWSTTANGTTFSDQSLQGATQYCYEIRAVRTVGIRIVYSGFSNVACATTLQPPPMQACCTRAIALDSMTVQVTWRDESYNEDGFRVYRWNHDLTSWTLVGTTTAEKLIDAGVPNAELGVCYSVVAFNSTGDATPVGPGCTDRPAAPTNVSFTNVDSQTVDIRWTDNSAIEDAYQVWAEMSWVPDCTGICDAVVYIYDWMVVELPANSTSYRCTVCSDVALWIVVKKGAAEAWSGR